jgi:GNAT superfamily N-acetyltransferase
METVVTSFLDPVVQDLVAAVQAEYVVRYGGPDDTPVDAAQFDPPDGVFLVGWHDGAPVATGALRRYDEDTVEIKRMFVPLPHRGKGFARGMLAALEARAREAGYRRIWLETGTAQPEAMALYESTGYVPIEGFGHYRWSPDNRCYGKEISER